MKEVYKDLPNYEGHYKVSNLGNVKSIKFKKEKILKGATMNTGYRVVNLSLGKSRKVWQVHQLVAITFLEHKINGHKLVVDHIDNNPLNNKLSNLQVVTHRKNLSKDKKGYSSKYVGITWHKVAKKWISQIEIKGERKYLGLFEDEYEAHLEYQKELEILKKC